MRLTFFCALFLGASSTAVAANPVYTVKCDEPTGQTADYGSIKDFWTNEEKLQQGVVNWEDGRYEGARPVFVFGEGLGDNVLYTTSMAVYDYLEGAVAPGDIDLFANYEGAKQGKILNGSNEGGVWIEFLAPTSYGIGVFALDSKTKAMVYTNAKVSGMLDSRTVSSWVFYSKCEWFTSE